MVVVGCDVLVTIRSMSKSLEVTHIWILARHIMNATSMDVFDPGSKKTRALHKRWIRWLGFCLDSLY